MLLKFHIYAATFLQLFVEMGFFKTFKILVTSCMTSSLDLTFRPVTKVLSSETVGNPREGIVKVQEMFKS